MGNSKTLIEQAAREIEASQKTSTTAAGRADYKAAQGHDPALALEGQTPPSVERVDAINQVFALFRLNYHNQFYAAYPDSDQLNQVKKLWLEALADYPIAQLLHGAKQAIETSEYLPTLNKMIECCRDSLSPYGLPDARSAFREACEAASPKSAQPWSHPAVYFAGREADWFLLASEPESKTWPVFQSAYQRWCGKVMAGEQLEIEAPEALPPSSGEISTRDEALAELEKIRASLAD